MSLSKPLTNYNVPNISNPSSLKSRYAIRKLTEADVEHAAAIVCHSNAFHSRVWPVLYPNSLSGLIHDMMSTIDHMVRHQIVSGHSYGVFDTEYTFKTAEAKEVGGKLLWSRDEPSVEKTEGKVAEGERLLRQMDFPLVSVALSYDNFVPFAQDKMLPLMERLPAFPQIYEILGRLDPRDPKDWQATGPGQVLMRNATSTRHDYEGEGIMGGLARWLMREADAQGFRSIQIESLSDAVAHVWSKSEEPYRAKVVCAFDLGTWKDEEGTLIFAPSTQRATKCWVDLRTIDSEN